MSTLSKTSESSSREQLVRWAKDFKLYALVDSHFDLPPRSKKRVLEFKDTDPVFYELIAWEKVKYESPVIVQIDLETLHWFLDTLSTERWGVFVTSNLDLHALTRHFQKFVITEGPDQNPYFLRFHDASVLEILLHTWSERERDVFTMPLEAIGYPELEALDVRIWKNEHLRSGPLSPVPQAEDCLLSVSIEQLRECAHAIDRDVVKIIYWHLRNHHARAVQYLPRATLENRIVTGLERARQYALSTIADLAGYVALMFELAPNFDDHPSFRSLLQTPLPEGSGSKIRRLSEAITDREWNEALCSFDREFWSRKKA